jgi:hypothetical protein
MDFQPSFLEVTSWYPLTRRAISGQPYRHALLHGVARLHLVARLRLGLVPRLALLVRLQLRHAPAVLLYPHRLPRSDYALATFILRLSGQGGSELRKGGCETW